jgi:hypothetical protein
VRVKCALKSLESAFKSESKHHAHISLRSRWRVMAGRGDHTDSQQSQASCTASFAISVSDQLLAAINGQTALDSANRVKLAETETRLLATGRDQLLEDLCTELGVRSLVRSSLAFSCDRYQNGPYLHEFSAEFQSSVLPFEHLREDYKAPAFVLWDVEAIWVPEKASGLHKSLCPTASLVSARPPQSWISFSAGLQTFAAILQEVDPTIS